MKSRSIKLSALTMLALVVSSSVFSALPKKVATHVKPSLISEVETVQPGRSFWVGVKLVMEPEWHTYWVNAGDSGGPTVIQWKLPEGFKAGEINWPTPEKIRLDPLVSYGYEHEVLFLTEITPPLKLKSNSVTITATVEWLECKVECIPGEATLNLALPISDSPPRLNSERVQEFSEGKAKWPLKSSDWKVAAFESEKGIRIEATPPADFKDHIKDLTFFAQDPLTVEYAGKETLTFRKNIPSLTVEKSDEASDALTHLKGLLVTSGGWRGAGSETGLVVDVPVQPDIAGPASSLSWGLALLFSFIGGLILNLMPCVLPVLSIKILGFVQQSHGNRSESIKHGLLYAFGVLLSFWILAGALIALRAGGAQLGWGFQLQNPAFVLGMAILFFILALSMFGVFQLGSSLIRLGGITAGRFSSWNSFLSGVLATIVATPCTAPFMGSALGYAISQPVWVAMSVFTALGVGMAFPYVLLSCFPSLLKFVPKPGPWMTKFEKFLGLLLMATVLWLLWVFALQKGIPIPFLTAESKTGEKISWEAYSEEAVQKYRTEGRPVFVDFTAAWCLTCQVNERVALSPERVVNKFKELNIAPLKADWTSRDPKITEALQRFGRNGVPFYVLYPADIKKDPVFLPEILTPDIVLDAVEKIKKEEPL